MENEIKVNEYVRTKYGEIGIVTGTHPRLKWRKKKASSDLDFNSIVKHSPNLIDLICEGDYVNKKYVDKIVQYESGKSIIALIGIIDEANIKEVVTKEIMESISYKVKQKEN